MGKSAIAFKDLGKLCSDLLGKDYKVGKSVVDLKTKTPNGITVNPTASKNGDKFNANLELKYTLFPSLRTEASFNTNGVISSKVETSTGLLDGSLITLECETSPPGKPGVLSAAKTSFDYTQELFNLKSSVDYLKGCLAVSAACMYKNLNLGCSVDYATNKSAVSKFSLALQFAQPDFTAFAKWTESMGSSSAYSCSYYHKISNDAQVGGELCKISNKAEIDLVVGCAYKLDKSTSIKGKVDADGVLSTSYKQQISSLTTMTLAAEIDTVNLTDSKHKFGLVLNLTP